LVCFFSRDVTEAPSKLYKEQYDHFAMVFGGKVGFLEDFGDFDAKT